jgi:hypothetical protein
MKQSSDISLEKVYQTFSRVMKDRFDIVKKISPSQYQWEQNNFRALVDLKSLGTHQVVQMVSNNTDLDKAAPEIMEEKSVRIKQRFDVKLMKKFHQLEVILDQDIKRSDAMNHAKAEAREEEYKNILTQAIDPENYGAIIDNLIGLDGFIHQDTIDCLGVLYKTEVLVLGD